MKEKEQVKTIATREESGAGFEREKMPLDPSSIEDRKQKLTKETKQSVNEKEKSEKGKSRQEKSKKEKSKKEKSKKRSDPALQESVLMDLAKRDMRPQFIQVIPKAGESHEKAVARLYPEEYEQYGRDMLPMEEINHGIQTTYRSRLMSKFLRAIKEYELLSPGDKLAVAISGGKDSLLTAKLFQLLQPYSDIPFESHFFAMDPGYLPENRRLLEFNLAWLGLPAWIFPSDVFATAGTITDKPCYLCARMRRGFLYAKAKELGCNKLALGHHFDDVIETSLLNILWSANFKVMMPKLISRNFENMELIRPLYFIREGDIINWRDSIGLKALDCACLMAKNQESSQRLQTKKLIQELKKTNPNVDYSIFRAGQNVAVDAILGYVNGGVHHSFLEHYGEDLCNF